MPACAALSMDQRHLVCWAGAVDGAGYRNGPRPIATPLGPSAGRAGLEVNWHAPLVFADLAADTAALKASAGARRP